MNAACIEAAPAATENDYLCCLWGPQMNFININIKFDVLSFLSICLLNSENDFKNASDNLFMLKRIDLNHLDMLHSRIDISYKMDINEPKWIGNRIDYILFVLCVCFSALFYPKKLNQINNSIITLRVQCIMHINKFVSQP